MTRMRPGVEMDVVVGPKAPVALRPRPRDPVHLHGFWYANHLSNPPRPYTNLTREVVSQIIGSGGVVRQLHARV